MYFLRQLTRFITLPIIGISCFAAAAFAETAAEPTDSHNLLSSVTIEDFESLSNRDALRRWIGAYDPALAADLAGSRWHTVEIAPGSTTGDLWLALNNLGFMQDLVVVSADPASGNAKVYFETDVLRDAPFFQASYWLRLNLDNAQPPTRVFVAREFRGKTFSIRRLELMTASEREIYTSNIMTFLGAFFGALFMLLAYNLALAVQLRSPLHGFYAAYCLACMLAGGWTLGLGYQDATVEFVIINNQ